MTTPVIIYQLIRFSADGIPYSGGVSTKRASGRRYIIESQIYPKSRPIRYGMVLEVE